MSGSHTPTAFPSWWMLKMLVSAESGKLTSENEPHPPGVHVILSLLASELPRTTFDRYPTLQEAGILVETLAAISPEGEKKKCLPYCGSLSA